MRWLMVGTALAALLFLSLAAYGATMLEIGGGPGEDKIVLSDAKCTAQRSLALLRPEAQAHYKQATYYSRDKSPGIPGCWREFQGVGGTMIGMVWDDGDNFAIPVNQFRKPAGA